jgi:tetratricopeptide (TPR) repeat protein
MKHTMPTVVLPTLVAPIVFVGLLWTLGCDGKKPGNDQGTVPSAAQPTDDDCVKFAKLLEKAVKSRDVAAFNQMIDWDAIVSRATTPPEGSKAFNDMFVLHTKQDLMNPPYGIATQTAKLIGEGGDFRCLRIHTMDGAKRLVFRLLVPKKPSLDYFEFVLSRRADGAVLASDYYSFRSGEMVSQRIRENYRRVASVASRALNRSKLTRDESDVVANNLKVAEMEALANSHDGRRALEIYAQLPETLRNEKGVLLTRLSAANSLGTGSKEYDEALQAIETALPGDPCLDFVLVDYYSSRRQYDKLRAAIDRLDTRVGGDPQQDARRALSYIPERNYKLARKYAQKAIEAEDSLFLPYLVLLQIALVEKNFDEVSRLMTLMEDKSLMEFPDLTTNPAYAEFVKSPQYQAWLRKAKPR